MFIGLLILLGIGAYFLFPYREGRSRLQFPGRRDAEETLRERYVNGEIDEETFRKMKETLGF